MKMAGANKYKVCESLFGGCFWFLIVVVTLVMVAVVPTNGHVKNASTNGENVLGLWRERRDAPSTHAQDQCNKTVGIYEEVTSPVVSAENLGKPMLCHYRFRPFRTNLRDWVLRIRFTRFKVGRVANRTHCDGGWVQIVDGGKSLMQSASLGASGKSLGGHFCGEIEQPQTFISETSVVRLIFYAENFTEQTFFRFDSRAEQQYEVYLRYGQHPELYPNRRGELIPNTYCERVFRDCRMQTCYVQSPGYPGLYPRGLRCKYLLNTRLPFIKLHLENEEFNVDGQRCDNLMLCPLRAISSGKECANDWLAVYDGRDSSARLIGKFCGSGKFPHSIIGTGSDLFVEFVSSPAGPLSGNTGFHFNVGHWPGHVETSGRRGNGSCDWVYTSEALRLQGDKQGLFWSVSHWYPARTRCSYLMQGSPTEIVRLVFPSFRIEKVNAPVEPYSGECAESLTIYDSDRADDNKIIKTFCDTSRPLEKFDFVSTGSGLYVVFESKTGSYAGSSLYYWATYDFFDNKGWGGRPRLKASGGPQPCGELFESWRNTSGRFGSNRNTLVYKVDGDGGSDDVAPIECAYQFLTIPRLFARIEVKVDNINFKYNQESCTLDTCHRDRVDKLLLIDENDKSENGSICLCKENLNMHQFPVTKLSTSTSLEVVLKVDPRHSLSNYFKSSVPLFEGSFRFVHGPLCGPTTLGPSPDGRIRFPFFYSPEKRLQPQSCHWTLQVTAGRSLYLNLERLVFDSSGSGSGGLSGCQEAKLELTLEGAAAPSETLLTLCSEHAKRQRTEISTQLPILKADRLRSRHIQMRLETVSAATVNFLIGWTEVTLLDSASSLPMTECGFLCPSGNGFCIPSELVCNGVANCPNSTADESEANCRQSDTDIYIWSRVLGVDFFSGSKVKGWVGASVIGAAVGVLLIICVCCMCRCCGGGGKSRPNKRAQTQELGPGPAPPPVGHSHAHSHAFGGYYGGQYRMDPAGQNMEEDFLT